MVAPGCLIKRIMTGSWKRYRKVHTSRFIVMTQALSMSNLLENSPISLHGVFIWAQNRILTIHEALASFSIMLLLTGLKFIICVRLGKINTWSNCHIRRKYLFWLTVFKVLVSDRHTYCLLGLGGGWRWEGIAGSIWWSKATLVTWKQKQKEEGPGLHHLLQGHKRNDLTSCC